MTEPGPDHTDENTGENAPPCTRGGPLVTIESIAQAACLVDRELSIVHANARMGSFLRSEPEALVGRSLRTILDEPAGLDAMMCDECGITCRQVAASISAVSSERIILCAGPRTPELGDLRLLTFTRADPKLGTDDPKGRQLLAAHLERTPLGVIEWRLDRTVRYCNPAALRIFGYAFEELSEFDVFPLIVDDVSRQHVDRIWQQLLSKTGGESSVNTNRTRDGRIIQCRWHNTPLVDDDGRVIGVASMVEDITERVESQRKISEARARLERVVSQIPVIVWALDEDLKPLLWNEHAEYVTGFTASEIIGHPDFLSLVHVQSEKERFLKTWGDLGYGDFDEIEVESTCADGTTCQILLSNIAARCPIPGWSAWGIGIDVTDRFRAFEALRQSERRFRDIIQSVDLAGVVVDADGRVSFVNNFFLELTGWSEHDVLGTGWDELLGPEVGCPVRGYAGKEHTAPERIEAQLITKAGDPRFVVWARSPLWDAEGNPGGAYVLGMDLTDHRRAQEELAAHRDQLEKLVGIRTKALAESERRLRDAERQSAMGRIAAGLSHDLGNVLLPVRCHLDTLLEAGLGERERNAVSAVLRGVELLEHLGDGLQVLGDSTRELSSSRDEDVEPIRLSEWWDEIRSLLEGVVPPRIALLTTVNGQLPSVRVPRHMLTRAVMNLLVNAVEAVGGVDDRDPTISLGAYHDTDTDEVVIAIRDNGDGIPVDLIRRVTDPFFTTKTRSLSTGLGLSIVNAVASTAHGRFEISNHPDGGAEAVLRLPAC